MRGLAAALALLAAAPLLAAAAGAPGLIAGAACAVGAIAAARGRESTGVLTGFLASLLAALTSWSSTAAALAGVLGLLYIVAESPGLSPRDTARLLLLAGAAGGYASAMSIIVPKSAPASAIAPRMAVALATPGGRALAFITAAALSSLLAYAVLAPPAGRGVVRGAAAWLRSRPWLPIAILEAIITGLEARGDPVGLLAALLAAGAALPARAFAGWWGAVLFYAVAWGILVAVLG